MAEPTEIRGTVQRITFANAETGYTVFRFLLEKPSITVTCVAGLPGIKEGGNLALTGDWQIHPQYGRNFRVESMKTLVPANETGMISFLGSGMFKNVRRKRAEAIFAAFGMESLKVIAEEPERLTGIPGITKSMAAQMQRTLLDNRQSERLTLYLQSHGMTAKQSLRIYRHYKERQEDDLIAFIEANPYRLAEDVFGIGFRTADRLALQLNIPPDSPLRLRVGLSYVLSQAAEEGHCFLPESELMSQASRQLAVAESAFQPLLEDLIGAAALIAEEAEGDGASRRIYLPPFYHSEVGTARRCQLFIHETLPQLSLQAKADDTLSPDQLAELEANLGLSLAAEQKAALEMALRHSFLIITGGPGTGKTTLLRALLRLFRRQRLRISLAAPTGRAARRLSEVTGVMATTLHRLLEYLPAGAGMSFQRNEENPLETDLVIVDEASMVDLLLFYNLLKALPPSCRLILVGDQDQLPSVGPGQVLRDLIASERVPTVRLQTVFRQAEQSSIVVNAHRINQGLAPQPGGRDSDFFFIERNEPTKVLEEIVQLCRRRLPAFAQVDPIEGIQVLCPMRRGVVGVESLNQALQQALNPPAREDGELHSLGDRYRCGDKVMQLRNNYDKGVFNGDIGRVKKVDADNEQLWVEYPDGERMQTVAYQLKELDELCLAYAISVHKAQGSEYPVVVMPILPEHNWLLQRNLLYTAVTRARKLLVLVGNRQLLRRTAERSEARSRHTHLCQRLNGDMDRQR